MTYDNLHYWFADASPLRLFSLARKYQSSEVWNRPYFPASKPFPKCSHILSRLWSNLNPPLNDCLKNHCLNELSIPHFY